MKLEITEALDGMLIRDILEKEIKFSGAIITFLKTREKGIVLNGERVTVRRAVKLGDILELDYSDDRAMAEKSEIFPVDLPLDILYEDDDVILLNKPPFMPTHPSHNHHYDTLANALRFYFDSKDHPFIFRAVNRLDNATSGIVLVAKNKLSAQILSDSIFKRQIAKSYLAILNGSPEIPEGEICAPIKREQESIIKRVIADDGAYSLTTYRTLATGDMFSLVEASPITGRTHQLRLHFSHIGHPICGDTLYGYPSHFINRQALHAYKISFIHPTSNKRITIKARPPKDMAELYKLAFANTNFDIERIFLG